MRLRTLLPVASLVLLTACIDEYEQCVRNSSKDLNVVNNLIFATQTILDRGYDFETLVSTEVQEVTCLTDEGIPATCLVEVGTTYQSPVAVDLDAERRKLDQLLKQRRILQDRMINAQEICRAKYPPEA